MKSIVAAALYVCVLAGGRAAAQSPPSATAPPAPPPSVVRVFIDCRGGCDGTYIRSELTIVDHVTDRKVADVHVLVTTRGTGGGGTEYTIEFIGLRWFERTQETLKYTTQPGATDDEVRRGLVQTLKLGLTGYAAQTPLRDRIEISFRPAANTGRQAGQTAEDPWNFWVFRLRGNADTSGEESNTSLGLFGAFSASRVTEAWKTSVNLSLNHRRNRYSFEEEGEDDYVSISRNSSASGTVVKTLGSHWGGGVRMALSSSTYTNQASTLRVSPVIEYNIFPYADTTRRQLTFRYAVGATRARYREITIYDKLQESRLYHASAVNWDLRQPWGSLDVQAETSQYVPDFGRNRLSLDGDVEVRLFKGFSLDVRAGTSRIRDQIYLPAGEATPEEILLRQRQVATSYSYGFSVGFSYSFGSVYNNVVNSRLAGF